MFHTSKDISYGQQRWNYQLMQIIFAILTFSRINHIDAFLVQNFRSSHEVPIDRYIVSRYSPRPFVTVLHQVTFADSWLPPELLEKHTDSDKESWIECFESKSVELMANLIRDKLLAQNENGLLRLEEVTTTPISLVHGKFVDLCCTVEGETKLENLFSQESVNEQEESVILGAVACLHSLLMIGMSYGLSGTPEQFDRWLSHLDEPGDDDESIQDYMRWDADSTRRLKFRSDRYAGTQLLAQLKWKQTAQGAFDLLVALGAWSKHEDLALLRSGFPIRFSKLEVEAARVSRVSYKEIKPCHQ